MTASRSSTEPGEPESIAGRLILVALALLCAAAAGVAVVELRGREHDTIKSTCERLAGAIERRDAQTAERFVSAQYQDGRGLNRTNLLKQLFVYLDAHGVTHVTPLSIVVHDDGEDRARATARLWLAQADPPPRGERDAVQLDLAFKREGGAWRVTSVEDWELPTEDFDQPDDP